MSSQQWCHDRMKQGWTHSLLDKKKSQKPENQISHNLKVTTQSLDPLSAPISKPHSTYLTLCILLLSIRIWAGWCHGYKTTWPFSTFLRFTLHQERYGVRAAHRRTDNKWSVKVKVIYHLLYDLDFNGTVRELFRFWLAETFVKSGLCIYEYTVVQ